MVKHFALFFLVAHCIPHIIVTDYVCANGDDFKKGVWHCVRKVISSSSKIKMAVVPVAVLVFYGFKVHKRAIATRQLLEAVEKGDSVLVEKVLKEGADVNSNKTISHETVLTYAAQEGYTDIVRILIKHDVNLDMRNKRSETPLMVAAKNGHVGIVQILLRNGAFVDAKNSEGQTALVWAILGGGNIDVVKQLIIEGKASLDKKDNTGCSALMYACYFGYVDIVELLLKFNVNIVLKNNVGYSACDITRISGRNSKKILELFSSVSDNKELGSIIEEIPDIEEMYVKADALPISQETKKEIRQEITYLKQTSVFDQSYSIRRSWLDYIFSLPWGEKTKNSFDIKQIKCTLDETHYGLKKVKDAICDSIALHACKKDSKINSPVILCLVGPPGVGKTTIGKAVAESLGRKFERVSLGGISNEAEIRGHRRVYVSAMPGRLIQAIKKAGSLNPVILLDEIDKVGQNNYHGSPTAALLEVLDPEQNSEFRDNYLNIPFDFSQVMFIATANDVNSILPVLSDRLEIIFLDAYTFEEKYTIGKEYLLKKIAFEYSHEYFDVVIPDEVLKKIIREYTHESGVRQLARVLKKLYAKAARSFLEENKKQITITSDTLESYLGPRKFSQREPNTKNRVGVVNGLAWTLYGGTMLPIEVELPPGKGELILTGRLGSIMKELARVALTYVKRHAKEFDIDEELFTTRDVHIHVPEGSVKKDGPSAGITMLTALLSAYTNCFVDARYAMTGEINLRGDVMAVGGIKEKVLAAKYDSISHIILPRKNKGDLSELKDLIDNIDIIFVDHVNEVFSKVLC